MYKVSGDILNQLQVIQSADTHFFSSFPIAIDEILRGSRLLLKPVSLNPGSLLDKFEKYLNEKFQEEAKLSDFGVQIYEFDYLKNQPNDWGFLSFSIAQLIGQSVNDIPKRTNKKEIAKHILEAMQARPLINKNLFNYETKVWVQKTGNRNAHPISRLNPTEKKIAYYNYRYFNSYIILSNG